MGGIIKIKLIIFLIWNEKGVENFEKNIEVLATPIVI